jgi:hypothetical protein
MDYKKWAEPHVYESNWAAGKSSVSGIKDGRYFLITKRALDGAVAFWYKPNTAHATLYPLLRNAAGEPVTQTYGDEKKSFTPNATRPAAHTHCCAHHPPHYATTDTSPRF